MTEIKNDMTDMHTHSRFSTDGRSELRDMVTVAKGKWLKFYGTSEHFDIDDYSMRLFGGVIDEEAYFSCARNYQSEFNDGEFTFAVGGEFNYINDKAIFEKFFRICERYRPDFVINSVHIVDGEECSRKNYFLGKTKEHAYSRYLEKVLESLDAPYPFDIVGHIGYVSRMAPYESKKIRYTDHAELYDAILTKIIKRGKILEVNSCSRGAESEFLPDTDVLSRYYELGGRQISFGSDAHSTDRIADKRDIVCAALKDIGFTFVTVPFRGNYIGVELR